MDVELPDGTILQGVPEGTTKAQLTSKLQAGGMGHLLASAEDRAMADPTRGMSTGAKVAAGAGRTLTNLGRGVAQWFGRGPTSDEVKEQRKADAPLTSTTAGKVGGFLGGAAPFAATAWIPGVNTYTGAMLAGATMGAAEPVTDEESRLTNTGVSAVAGAAGKHLGDKVAGAVTSKLAERKASLATQQGQNATRDATLKASQEAGYVMPPSAVSPSFWGNRMESAGGKAALGQQASAMNQKTTDKLVRAELGIPENQAISTGTLQAIRETEGKVYAQVAGLSKDADEALKQLKQARFDATAQWKHYNRSADPAALTKAKTASADAQLWEQLLEVEAMAHGRQDLVPALQAARQRIAKTYDVERALNTSTGEVSARELSKLLEHGKLSGNLETAARFADAFPQYAREASRIPTPGVSKSEAILGTILGAGGAASMGPAGAAMAAIPLASAPIRAGLLSGPGQRMFARPPSYTPSMRERIAASLAPSLPRVAPGSAQSLLIRNTEQQDSPQ